MFSNISYREVEDENEQLKVELKALFLCMQNLTIRNNQTVYSFVHSTPDVTENQSSVSVSVLLIYYFLSKLDIDDLDLEHSEHLKTAFSCVEHQIKEVTNRESDLARKSGTHCLVKKIWGSTRQIRFDGNSLLNDSEISDRWVHNDLLKKFVKNLIEFHREWLKIFLTEEQLDYFEKFASGELKPVEVVNLQQNFFASESFTQKTNSTKTYIFVGTMPIGIGSLISIGWIGISTDFFKTKMSTICFTHFSPIIAGFTIGIILFATFIFIKNKKPKKIAEKFFLD
jgi:hypothetical protein